MNKVIIVGSGIAGLATAVRLKAKGYDVKIFESASHTGGKIHAFNLGDYRFDAGPSLFTLPHLFDELFNILGENPRNFFSKGNGPHKNPDANPLCENSNHLRTHLLPETNFPKQFYEKTFY